MASVYNDNATRSLNQYASLGTYNGHMTGMMGRPVVPATSVSGVYIVPDYSSIGYSTLSHGMQPSYRKYFTMAGAYGAGAGQCNTQYVKRMCGANSMGY